MATLQRTLLLAPPSISSHPTALEDSARPYDRSSTDIQMIDRLAAGLVTLPAATYDLILLLTDFDGSRTETSTILNRQVLAFLVAALRPGGRIQSQDNTFAAQDGPERTEAILAGLTSDGRSGMRKPEDSGAQAIPLRFGRNKAKANAAGGPAAASEVVVTTNGNGKRPSLSEAHQPQPQQGPAGVGFVDFGDDLDEPIIIGEDDLDMDLDFDDDDNADLIDENSLLTEEDMARPVIPRNVPPPQYFPSPSIP